MVAVRLIFLSTPSARRATSAGLEHRLNVQFLSTPSARRATTVTQQPRGTSIFLSTPSARRATDSFEGQFGLFDISIHALREEGDL